jgi:hypothetical protein
VFRAPQEIAGTAEAPKPVVSQEHVHDFTRDSENHGMSFSKRDELTY